MTKILLTGGSGFIAAHILEQLLSQGHTVITTVRSEEKAEKIRDAHKDSAERLQVVIVPDIAQEDAFDEVVKTPGLEGVLHTASPFHFKFTDPQKALIDPALIGTTAILKALHRSAPTVKRVVITSSFAAIMSESGLADPTHTFSEASWNPVTIADIHKSPSIAYRASKTLAEQAAWDFVKTQNTSFDLATVNPPLVLGPVVHDLATLESINTSNARFVDLLQGKWKEGIPASAPALPWVDVRDVARAHIRALEAPEASGKRLFTTPGFFSNRQVVEIVRENFPEYADKLPGPEVAGGELPAKGEVYSIDNAATNEVLGFEYTTLEKSVTDLVTSLKEHGV